MCPRIICHCCGCSNWQLIIFTGCVMCRLLVRWWILMWRVFMTWNCWPGSSFSATSRQRRLPSAWESLLRTSCGSWGVSFPPPFELYASPIPLSLSSFSLFLLLAFTPHIFSPFLHFSLSPLFPSLYFFLPSIFLAFLPASSKVTEELGSAVSTGRKSILP